MPLAPMDRDSGVDWAAATVPARSTLIRFRWKYRDAGKSYAGRAAVRIAPPDSLRLDYAGPFNWGAGAALVVGGTMVRADPDKNLRCFVPAERMLGGVACCVRSSAVGGAVVG